MAARKITLLPVVLFCASWTVAATTHGATPQDNATSPQTSAPPTTAGENAREGGAVVRVAPGSVIPVQLSKSIDAKKAKSGDEVSAKVTQDLKTNAGEVLIPKDTKVLGHVTAVQPRSKEQNESELGIAFDRAVLKNGSEMRMPLSIQAIIAPPNANAAGSGSGGGYDQDSAMPNGPAGASPTNGRPNGMGGSSPTANVPSNASEPADSQSSPDRRRSVTANTQGVVGISNLRLTTIVPGSAQGSLVSSEKNTVKLDSGTLMLLRVNP